MALLLHPTGIVPREPGFPSTTNWWRSPAHWDSSAYASAERLVEWAGWIIHGIQWQEMKRIATVFHANYSKYGTWSRTRTQWLDKMPSSQAMLTHLLKPITRQSSLTVDLSLATIATSALGVQTSPEPMAGVPGSVSPEWPQTFHNHLCQKMPIFADILRYSIGGQRTYCILIVCMFLFTLKWTTKTSIVALLHDSDSTW